MKITKSKRRLRIRRGIRNKIVGTSERPRLSVFKSNKAVYAQLVDDSNGHTVAAANSIELGTKTNNIDNSKQVGSKLAERAKAAGIESILFDRSGYQYHGKIKALADGAREGGLKF
jgi:large subunit ribosomal protein L18